MAWAWSLFAAVRSRFACTTVHSRFSAVLSRFACTVRSQFVAVLKNGKVALAPALKPTIVWNIVPRLIPRDAISKKKSHLTTSVPVRNVYVLKICSPNVHIY